MESSDPIPPREKKLWFRAKTYGYGWYPASWQGWTVVGLYLLLVFIASWDILRGVDNGPSVVKRFVLTILALSFFLLYISYTHGEKPRWRWGKDDAKDHDDTRPT